MHEIEPFYNWRHLYVSEEDERSPFYGRVYSEFEFSQTIYNYYIHPQWDEFFEYGITKFIIIAENVLNFHSGDKDYYEEWFEEVTDAEGWIACLNMPEQTQHDFRKAKLNRFIELIELPNWRTYKPFHLFTLIDKQILNRLA